MTSEGASTATRAPSDKRKPFGGYTRFAIEHAIKRDEDRSTNEALLAFSNNADKETAIVEGMSMPAYAASIGRSVRTAQRRTAKFRRVGRLKTRHQFRRDRRDPAHPHRRTSVHQIVHPDVAPVVDFKADPEPPSGWTGPTPKGIYAGVAGWCKPGNERQGGFDFGPGAPAPVKPSPKKPRAKKRPPVESLSLPLDVSERANVPAPSVCPEPLTVTIPVHAPERAPSPAPPARKLRHVEAQASQPMGSRRPDGDEAQSTRGPVCIVEGRGAPRTHGDERDAVELGELLRHVPDLGADADARSQLEVLDGPGFALRWSKAARGFTLGGWALAVAQFVRGAPHADDKGHLLNLGGAIDLAFRYAKRIRDEEASQSTVFKKWLELLPAALDLNSVPFAVKLEDAARRGRRTILGALCIVLDLAAKPEGKTGRVLRDTIADRILGREPPAVVADARVTTAVQAVNHAEIAVSSRALLAALKGGPEPPD